MTQITRQEAWRLATRLNHLAGDIELVVAEILDENLTLEEVQQLKPARDHLKLALGRLVELREQSRDGAA